MKRTIAILITSILLVAVFSAAWWYGARQSPDLAPGRQTETIEESEEMKSQEKKDATPEPAESSKPLSYTSPKGVTIKLDQPLEGSTLMSPLTIRGQVPGNWSFEASFPVEVRDASGTLLEQRPAQLQANWMTTEYVPFEVTLVFDAPAQKSGVIVFHKDNPSGLPENDDSITVNVRFQ